MHRLFVPECLKRQRYLISAGLRLNRSNMARTIAPAVSFSTALVQQFAAKTHRPIDLSLRTNPKYYISQLLEKSAEIPTPFRHVAPLLQQRLQHEKGAPLARGALPATWLDQVFIESKNSELF